MNEEKPNQKPKYKFSYERLSTYIPKELHNSQVEEFVIEALKYYTSRRRGRKNEPSGNGCSTSSYRCRLTRFPVLQKKGETFTGTLANYIKRHYN